MDREAAPALNRVALGLGFFFAGLALLVIILCVTVFITAAVTPVLPMAAAAPIAIGILLAVAMQMLGQFLCLWVPREAGVRGWLVVAITLKLLAQWLAFMELLAALLDWFPQSGVLVGIFIAVQIISLISAGCFLFYLMRLARYLENGDAELDAEAVMVLGVIAIILLLAALGAMYEAMAILELPNVLAVFESPKFYALLSVILFGLCGGGALVVGAVAFLKYCNLLISLRETILRHLATLAADLHGKKRGLAPL